MMKFSTPGALQKASSGSTMATKPGVVTTATGGATGSGITAGGSAAVRPTGKEARKARHEVCSDSGCLNKGAGGFWLSWCDVTLLSSFILITLGSHHEASLPHWLPLCFSPCKTLLPLCERCLFSSGLSCASLAEHRLRLNTELSHLCSRVGCSLQTVELTS